LCKPALPRCDSLCSC